MCVAADRLDGSTNVFLGGPSLLLDDDDFLVGSLSSCVLFKENVRVRRALLGNVDDTAMQDLPSDDDDIMVVEGVWKAEDIPQHPNRQSDNANIIIYRLRPDVL